MEEKPRLRPPPILLARDFSVFLLRGILIRRILSSSIRTYDTPCGFVESVRSWFVEDRHSMIGTL